MADAQNNAVQDETGYFTDTVRISNRHHAQLTREVAEGQLDRDGIYAAALSIYFAMHSVLNGAPVARN